jgi:precorrin-2/cobalt-factor-2 C20-methyltransferase
MNGKLYGIGVGPGDPELITVKALRTLQGAFVVAYPQPDGGTSFARAIVDQYLTAGQLEIPIIVPMDTKRYPAQSVYDAAALTIAHHLAAGSDVVVLCEGDPFFYGSFMYLHERLAGRYPVEIIPGVSSIMAAAAAIGRPLAARNDVLTVIPAPLDDGLIKAQIEHADAVVIIKLGRHFARIKALIVDMGLMANAAYVERVSLHNQKLMPLEQANEDAPYFSMILIYKGAEKWVLDLPAGAHS